MAPPCQLLSNDRAHALIKASGRDPLGLVPEVAMATATEPLSRFWLFYGTAAAAAARLGCISHRRLACGAPAKARDRLDLIRGSD